LAGRRLTRKEIVQEDQIHSTINQIFHFVLEKKELLLLTLACAVGLALAIYFWVDYQSGKKSEVQLAFSNAMEIYAASVGDAPAPEAGTPPDTRPRYKTENEKYTAALKAFGSVKETASGTALEEYADYYEGLCQKGLGKKDEFVKTMERLAAKGGDSEIAGLADFALGEYYLANSDVEKAQLNFEKIFKSEKTNLPKDNILNDMGDYFEKRGQKDRAKATYERLLKDYPESRLKTTVQAKLTNLGSPEKK
jgi:tetratricopeptide (TPR) repeat protein